MGYAAGPLLVTKVLNSEKREESQNNGAVTMESEGYNCQLDVLSQRMGTSEGSKARNRFSSTQPVNTSDAKAYDLSDFDCIQREKNRHTLFE